MSMKSISFFFCFDKHEYDICKWVFFYVRAKYSPFECFFVLSFPKVIKVTLIMGDLKNEVVDQLPFHISNWQLALLLKDIFHHHHCCPLIIFFYCFFCMVPNAPKNLSAFFYYYFSLYSFCSVRLRDTRSLRLQLWRNEGAAWKLGRGGLQRAGENTKLADEDDATSIEVHRGKAKRWAWPASRLTAITEVFRQLWSWWPKWRAWGCWQRRASRPVSRSLKFFADLDHGGQVTNLCCCCGWRRRRG